MEYSDNFSRSEAKNSFWYLDTNDTIADTNTGFEARRLQTQANNDNGGGGAKDVNTIIPLNRQSLFEELEDKMLVPMQLQFNIELNSDDELIHKANGADSGCIVVNRFLLWIPKLTPKGSLYEKFVRSFLKETQWTYMREKYEVSAPNQAVDFSKYLLVSIYLKRIFVYLKNRYIDDNGARNAELSPYLMKTFALEGKATLNNCRLEYGNDVFYPETEYDKSEYSTN